MSGHTTNFTWGCRRSVVFLILLLVGLSGLALPQPTLAADNQQSADVIVTIRPEPSIQVARGSILAYELRVQNRGDRSASSILVHMPYNPGQITLVGTQFAQSNDFVSVIAGDYIKVRFAKLEKNRERTATLYMQVADNLPDGTVINMWAGYSWDADDGAASARSSNAAPVLVGDTNQTSAWVWMMVTPVQAPVGTTHTFFSDRFMPSEQVFVWLNTPDGPQGLDFSVDADTHGRVQIGYASSALTPGTYQMVAQGERSQLTAVTTFIVTP